MSEISKRFEQIVVSTQKKLLESGAVMPVRTDRGIRVGCAEIVPEGSFKHIYVKDDLIYKDISLNKVAIRLANELALNKRGPELDALYNLDREYSRYFIDSSFFLQRFHSAQKNNDEFRQELMWTRYVQSKARAEATKEKAEQMAAI